MSNQYVFEIDTKAFGRFLKSNEMLSHMQEVAKKRAGSDTHIKSFVGYDRAKSIIYPNTKGHPS